MEYKNYDLYFKQSVKDIRPDNAHKGPMFQQRTNLHSISKRCAIDTFCKTLKSSSGETVRNVSLTPCCFVC